MPDVVVLHIGMVFNFFFTFIYFVYICVSLGTHVHYIILKNNLWGVGIELTFSGSEASTFTC